MSDLNKVTSQAPNVLDRFNLTGKTALVVGGSKGLGQAMAVALAGAGSDVCIASRGPNGLQETEDAITKMGRKGYHVAVDVTEEQRVVHLVEEVKSEFGGIDILVNSQGTVFLDATTHFPVNTWQWIMDVNVKSIFLCCKHIGKLMLAKGQGKIINISSVRGFQGRAGDPAYAPSKGAVNQLTRSLAIEWGPKGINVNAIAPVFTYTAISRSFLEDEKKRNWVLSRIPMKRVGELDDLFGPVIFLASEASNFVNGHVLPVDGGWLAA